MGDRVIIFVTDGDDLSPAIYCHWLGDRAIDCIREAAPNMRKSDVSYAAARLISYLGNYIDGPLSLGVWNVQAPPKIDINSLKSHSHGDAGVVLVNITTGEITVGGGYLENPQEKLTNFYEG